jgi:hypothetical protein
MVETRGRALPQSAAAEEVVVSLDDGAGARESVA